MIMDFCWLMDKTPSLPNVANMLPIPDEALLYRIALTFIEGIGSKTARALLSHFGDAKSVITAPVRDLKAVGGMGETRARACKNVAVMQHAEQELIFAQKHGVQCLFLSDENYPSRLKACVDAPMMLYYKGSTPALDANKMIAVIGTRKNTDYGLRATEELIQNLRSIAGVTIVSGLAYGIDAIAHRQALKSGLPTIGVVAHGLDRVYPTAHKSLAKEMIAAGGGMLTEFPSGTSPERTNFPVRNRIVAGLCDVTVIVESDEKGGAMITAYMAASYNRDVCAYPGRIYDGKSGGPNKLIKINIASLITGADDLLAVMNWQNDGGESKVSQQQLFSNLSPDEEVIVTALRNKDSVHADELMLQTEMGASMLAATLLQLEMMNIVKTLPGKRYRLC